MRTILRTPSLLELSLCGFGFAAVQVCLSSFLVVYLTESLQWSLVAAGLALTCTTFAAVPGRIIWGAIADRTRSASRVLAAIGIVAAACGVVLAWANPGWPTVLVLLVSALYGFSAVGWNGVQLAELARRAPPGMAAAITGASGFITFGGVMLGPVAFAALVGVTGFATGFGACAVLSGVTSAALLMRKRG
jgi:sugar phosphate permease